MENKVLEGNLGLIAGYNKRLAIQIEGLKNLRQSFELVKTQKDEYNLLVNGVEIHANNGALDEAKKITNGINNLKEKNSICVVFGLGLGYLFDEIVQNANGSVILFEPNLEILKCTLEIVDMAEILAKKNVVVCSEIEDLKFYIGEFSNKLTKISVSFLTSYYNIYFEQIKEIATIVEYAHGEVAARHNTILNCGNLTVKNTLLNLNNIFQSNFIKDFKNKFENKPAIIVSAGPSLALNIELIKKNQNKFVIFCVGTALRALTNSGITPDFTVIIEPYSTSGQIENLNLENTTLIMEPYTSPDIWNLQAKNKVLFCSKYNFLNDWLCDGIKINNENLASVGTVSYCALSSASLMGCNPIVLIGQDLAYTNGVCYAKGSAYEDLECILNSETNKFEIVPKNYEKYLFALMGEGLNATNKELAQKTCSDHLNFLNESLYTVDGQNGEKLPTQTGYAIFIKHFENFAKENTLLYAKRAKLINSSTGGAQINGFENQSFADFLQNNNKEIDKNIALEKTTYDIENLTKKAMVCTKEIQEAKEYNKGTILLFEKIVKEFQLRKTISKNVEKMFEKLRERMNFFDKKYFMLDSFIYYTIYHFYSGYNRALKEYSLRPEEIVRNYEYILPLLFYVDKSLDEILPLLNIPKK